MTTVAQTSPRGIPRATFISNIDEWIQGESFSVEEALNSLQETLSKYKFMFAHLEQRQKALDGKLPEIRKSIEAIEFIDLDKDTSKPLLVEIEHADTLYTSAHIPSTIHKVNLWLGANIMVEYEAKEALELLKEKQVNTERNIKDLEGDLLYLREQITTMEVNIARVYNWNVKKTRVNAES